MGIRPAMVRSPFSRGKERLTPHWERISSRITVIQQAYAYLPTVTLANLTIYMATGKSVDSLTGVTAFKGTTDRNYNAGDVFDIRVTAGTINDIQTALVNLNTQVNAADFSCPCPKRRSRLRERPR